MACDSVSAVPPPPCSVCVVTYNNEESMSRLLRSLVEEPLDLTIHVLDNSSTDGTVAVVRRVGDALRLDVRLEARSTNSGFPAGCNRLLKATSHPVVAVLNPDVELAPGALSHLVSAVAGDRSIGVATCRLMTRTGTAQTAPARARPRLRHLVTRDSRRRLLRAMNRDAQDTLRIDRDVECMSGALMVFRRDVLKQIGYLDESVFMFLEDIDFAARVRRAGYRIRYFGTVWAWHDCQGSTRRHDGRLEALAPRVWINYLYRYGSPLERTIVRPYMFMLAGGKALLRLLAGESPVGQLSAMWGAVTYRATEVSYD